MRRRGSRGSFLAASYAINREPIFEADAAGRTPFERDFLKRGIARELIGQTVGNIVRIGTSAVNRSNVAAEHYGRRIFADRTYSISCRSAGPMS